MPIFTYCSQNLIHCLEELLNRPSMLQLCEEWRNRTVENDKLCDVYDGQMWEHFEFDCMGEPFLANSAGIIPDPSDPSKNANSYLDPIAVMDRSYS